MFLPKYMMKVCLVVLLVLSACTPKPTEPLVLPTLIQFPTLTPTSESIENTISVEISPTITAVSSTPVVLYVNVDTTNIFACPDLTCEILGTVDKGQALTVIYISQEWHQLDNETLSGYVLSRTLIDTIDITATSTETTLTGVLTVSPTATNNNNTIINTPQPNVDIVRSNTATASPTNITSNTNTNSGSNTIIVIPTLIQGGNNVNPPATSSVRTSTPVNTRISPTTTRTTTRTPTATATTSFNDLPDLPDSVLTPVILGDPGLPVVVTVTPEPDTALPTIQQMPTNVPPGS